jgi:homoserine acetyltransferase
MAITSDPAFDGGRYTAESFPTAGMRVRQRPLSVSRKGPERQASTTAQS